MIKLDYSIESPEERNKLVQKIIEENPDLSENYLEILANYLILCMEKQEKKEKKILTENRMVTVNKRETSFEGLVAQFENGEDGIYNLITDNKHTIFRPKVTITKKDLEEIPFLKQIREAIKYWEDLLQTASGRDAYIIKKTIIDLRKEQYLIKDAYRNPVVCHNITRSRKSPIPLDGEIWLDENGYCQSSGIELVNPEVCSAILCDYQQLKWTSKGHFDGDTYYMMEDFDRVYKKALADQPLYKRLVECKINGMQNIEIQQLLQEEFGIKHSLEYISSLWRNKIPNLIASAAEDEYLDWYYLNIEKGKYKKCSRCGEIKLAHNKYFSKNNTSKDGFYSICKSCRNKKKK